MSPEFVWFMAALVAAGLFAGFIGGLFGVGGGIVLVPALYLIFSALNVDEHVRMHVAVATSISTIISTSWRSLSTHAKSGAVDFNVLKTWGPWIALGAVIGSALASAASTQSLVIYFGVGLLIAAAQLGFGNPNWRLVADLPRGAPRALIATILGACSAAMGIGGGTFGVPMMTLMGRPIHQAVATASGFGAAIALPATLGFVITGWGHPGLPLGSLGFVNTPGFVLLGLLTAITAPLGARLAHRLDQRLLRRAFAVFLALTAFNLLRNALR